MDLSRLSGKETLILELLLDQMKKALGTGRGKKKARGKKARGKKARRSFRNFPGVYGLELVNLSNGALKRGTVYTTLYRMEQKGLIAHRLQDPLPTSGVPKRFYRATELGKRIHEAFKEIGRLVNG